MKVFLSYKVELFPSLRAMTFKRIHIIGGAGSGKTTLAKEYSVKYDIPHFELDDIMWVDAAAREKRPEKERDERLRQAINSEHWLLEGIFWLDWVIPSLERAEKIIVLNIPARTRHIRVIKRHFKFLAAAHPSQYHRFIPTLSELILLNHHYANGPYKKTLKLLSRFIHKVVVCNSNREAELELGL
jgi:dephospho-CoA kinase